MFTKLKFNGMDREIILKWFKKQTGVIIENFYNEYGKND